MKMRGSGISKVQMAVACLIVFTMVCLLWAAQPTASFAEDAAESLTIRYCYSDGKFTKAAVFTETDFSGAYEESYSFMDSMPAPCMDAVTGVLLSDLLSDAGIDIDDVDKLAFYAIDAPDRPVRTFTKSDLYASRYYYPHITEYWNTDSQSFTAEDSVTDVTCEAVKDRVRVYPMICISDNWVRGAIEPDFSYQDASTRYRLVIGQPDDPTEITARDSLKWIYQIDVKLKGSAPTPIGSGSSLTAGSSSANKSVTGVSLDKTTSLIDVGSAVQLTATVIPEDAADKTVTWNSSDTAVATVSDTGLVTAVAPGTATITVTTSDCGKTAACALTVNPVAISTPVVTLPSTPAVTAPPVTLNDITGHWAESGINHLVSLGAVGGYPDGSFRPDNTINRAEFATMLVKAFGLTAQGETAFDDTYSHWANGYISCAASSGIISGYGDGVFGPEELITREQMAVMVMKAAKLATAAGSAGFADSGSISAWAAEAVAAVTENRIMKGYPDNTFKPRGNATRAEAVTTIFNALK